MLRSLRLPFLLALVVVAVWRLGYLPTLVGVVRTGVDTMTGRQAIEFTEDARRTALRSSLERAIEGYRATNEGQDPPDLDALVAAGLLWPSDLEDEWGRRLVTEKHDRRLVVRGLGRDGERSTADDWTVGE